MGTLKNPLPRWDFDFYKRKLPTAGIIFRVKITGGILVGGILSKLFFKFVFSSRLANKSDILMPH